MNAVKGGYSNEESECIVIYINAKKTTIKNKLISYEKVFNNYVFSLISYKSESQRK